jgi:multiple sugar transport system substrate-binding protein
MKKAFAVSTSAFLLATLVGCGGSNQSAPSSTAAATAGTASSSAPAANANGTTELTFWTFLNPQQADDPRSAALKDIVDSFNASQNKTKIKVEGINFAKIDSQVIQAVAAGKGPDILNVYTDQLQMHVAAKTIQPITKFATPWLEKNGKDYIYSADQLKLNNEIMAMPWESRIFTMYYRKDLYDKAGLPAPSTLPELLESAVKVGDKTRLGYAVGLSEGANAASLIESFVPVLRAAGGELIDKNGKAAFNTDAGVKAVQFYKDMVSKGATTEQAVSMTADDITNGLKAGNIATAFAGSMRASAIKSSDVGKNIATAPIPPFEKGQPVPVTVASQTLTIGSNTKYADQAWEFIQYYLSKDSQVKWAKASVMPVLSSAYEDPAVKQSPNYADLMQWKENASKYGKMEFYPEDYAKLASELAKGVQKIVFKNAPAKETLDAVANAYNSSKK